MNLPAARFGKDRVVLQVRTVNNDHDPERSIPD
jgi:hypothetical protein